MRPGSANDQSVLNYSKFGTVMNAAIPKGLHIVADAGYSIRPNVMVPYPDTELLSPKQTYFNNAHSRTRIIIERTNGIIKNRFCILKMPLNQKINAASKCTAQTQMAKVVHVCLVLHNMLIACNDDTEIDDKDSSSDSESDDKSVDDDLYNNIEARLIGEQVRDQIADYLFSGKD